VTRLKQQLIRHEGLRLKPYTDTVGKLTIGVGRNLTDVGISKDEAYYLLDNDIHTVIVEVNKTWPWVANLVPARRDVIYNMAFNMGVPTLAQFQKFLLAAREGQLVKAKAELLNSRWAQQVKTRADELVRQYETGEYV